MPKCKAALPHCWQGAAGLHYQPMPAHPAKPFAMPRCHFPGVEAVQAQSRHQFGRHMHEQFGIGVVLEGGQKSLSSIGTVEALAGDTITVNPGEIHDGAPLGNGARTWLMLYFEPALIIELMADVNEGGATQPEFKRPVMADLRVSRAVQNLFHTMTAPHASTLAAEEQMLLLFARVMRQAEIPIMSTTPAIHHARNLIDDDPAASLSLQSLATQNGLSRFQLLRAFSKATGMTPHAYILQRRLQLARRLIGAGVPLVQVALDCGFADQSHLTRLFIRNFGISPGHYANLS